MISDGMSAIRGLVGRARTRLRLQGALEGATTASILALAGALAVVYGLRTDFLTSDTATILFVVCGGAVLAGAVIGAARRIDDERVARRIDRASGLADRLSTAVAFERAFSAGKLDAIIGEAGGDAEETQDMMQAAIRDAVRAAPKANIAAAAPFAIPRDARTAGIFAVVCTALALIHISRSEPAAPTLTGVTPEWGRPGAHVIVHGTNLRVGHVQAPLAAGAAGTVASARDGSTSPVRVTLGRGQSVLGMKVLDWNTDAISVEVPANARFGLTDITVYLDDKRVGDVAFTVVDPKDAAYHSEDSVELTADDLDWAHDLIRQIRMTAPDDPTQDLDKYADKLEKLLEQAERGELTKDALMAALDKAQEDLHKGEEPDQSQVNKDLADTGKQLEKNPMTKDLAQALEKGDLQKAKEEMEKLADKLDKGQLSDKEKQDLAKDLDKAAKDFQAKDQKRDYDMQKQLQKQEDELKEMERKLKDPKTKPEEKQDLERRIDQKQRDLKQLKKDEEQKDQSEQRRSLKRLHQKMEDAAKDLQQKPQNQQQQQQQQRQSSQKMKDIARETGAVDKDQRKTAAVKKAATQMDDLREALARAKRRGSKGPQDPFNRGGKESDFAKRAGGGKGNRQAWKQGQGQGQGKGQKGGKDGKDGNGGQSDKPDGPSNDWGDGHDPNLTGDPTAMSGNDNDQSDQGVQGKEGASKRQTIVAAAQKGFATAKYKKVYAEYDDRVEQALNTEKVPPAYRYYVKKYFNKIKPHDMPDTSPSRAAAP